MPGKATWELAEPPSMALEDARAELVRRFLRVYGPATHTQLASWAQTAPSHAKRLFEAIRDELEPAAVEGPAGVRARVGRGSARGSAGGVGRPAARRPRPLRRPARPRHALVADGALRKQLFPPVGARASCLRTASTPPSLWRGHKKGRRIPRVGPSTWLGEPGRHRERRRRRFRRDDRSAPRLRARRCAQSLRSVWCRSADGAVALRLPPYGRVARVPRLIFAGAKPAFGSYPGPRGFCHPALRRSGLVRWKGRCMSPSSVATRDAGHQGHRATRPTLRTPPAGTTSRPPPPHEPSSTSRRRLPNETRPHHEDAQVQRGSQHIPLNEQF